jgi:uncharacterized iron-regulated membrane protein
MWLRTLHRWVGLVMAPFILITAVTGGVLLWRRQYSPDLKHDLLDWHNWEGLADYLGAILAVALAWMALSGWALWLQVRLRKRRAKKQST